MSTTLHFLRLTPLLVGATLGSDPAAGRVWHLDPAGTGDAPTIQAAIDSAAVGDVIELECGTYYEHGLLMKSGLTLRSTTGLPDCVTIDAEQLDKVILCPAVETGLIEGITFTGGQDVSAAGMYCGYPSAFTVSHCDFVGNQATQYDGGAISCYGADPQFVDCRFLDNVSLEDGGAVYLNTSAATFLRCTFSTNQSVTKLGGAVHIYASTPSFEDCTFDDNEASNGGGVFSWYATSVFRDCTFTNNRSNSFAGAYLYNAQATFVDCGFTSNTATSGFGGGLGGLQDAEIHIARCEITGNTAVRGGGVAAGFEASLTAVECEILGNSASTGSPDGYLYADSSALLRCCAIDLAQWADPDFITIDDDVCPVPTGVGAAIESMSWGRLKGSFRAGTTSPSRTTD